MQEKYLPMSIDMEQAVLGCIMIDPEAIVQIADTLSAGDFYRDSHKTMYAIIEKMYLQREPADLLTLSEALERENKLEDIGGFSYLASLSNAVPSSHNAEYYAKIVATKAEHRRRIEAASKIATMSYEEAEDAQNKSQQLLDLVDQRGASSDFVRLSEVLYQCMEQFDQMKSQPGAITGVPTCYHGIDSLTSGLQKSDLVLLAARPAVGKTTFAQNIAYNAMTRFDMRVGFFSLEMNKIQLAHRFIAMASHINSQRLRTGQIDDTRNEWDTIQKVIGTLSDGHLWIDDTAGIDIDVMRSRARRLHAQEGLDLIIVDYLQLMHATLEGKRPMNRVQEVSEVSAKLKQVARDLNIPVLALAQLSRNAENHVVPQLSDLRDSGTLEQDADIVMFLSRVENEDNRLDVTIAKHRNGPEGTVKLGFEKQFTRFYNIDQEGNEVR